jgi:hypothetical protein
MVAFIAVAALIVGVANIGSASQAIDLPGDGGVNLERLFTS